jgi:hypothetical protein
MQARRKIVLWKRRGGPVRIVIVASLRCSIRATTDISQTRRFVTNNLEAN